MLRAFTCALWLLLLLGSVSFAEPLAIRLSDDGSHFVDSAGKRFRVWGVNYDHDDEGRLLEDYWSDAWSRVIEDFQEIKALGANVVRIHLQLGKFMTTADQPNEASLAKLKELIQLAEQQGLYLDVTGLACYHKADVPKWYDELGEAERWRVQANFWRAVASTCKNSPAIFCYDLMNEPIMPADKSSDKPDKEWLTGELGGKYFVQRITLDMRGRTREQVADAWVSQLTQAIHEVDQKHLITVGVIPWSHVFPGAKPIFYGPAPAKHLDFVSVHMYPKSGEVQKALDALTVYRIGKPLVVEEFFPLSCSIEDAEAFIRQANIDGVVSFYWGKTIAQYEKDSDIKGAIISKWLRKFEQGNPADNRNPAP